MVVYNNILNNCLFTQYTIFQNSMTLYFTVLTNHIMSLKSHVLSCTLVLSWKFSSLQQDNLVYIFILNIQQLLRSRTKRVLNSRLLVNS